MYLWLLIFCGFKRVAGAEKMMVHEPEFINGSCNCLVTAHTVQRNFTGKSSRTANACLGWSPSSCATKPREWGFSLAWYNKRV